MTASQCPLCLKCTEYHNLGVCKFDPGKGNPPPLEWGDRGNKKLTRMEIWDAACFDDIEIRDDRVVRIRRCEMQRVQGTVWETLGTLDDDISIEEAWGQVMDSYSK